MTPEQDLVQVLLQLFPSFRALPPGEPEKRAEALGLYAAQAWAAGPDGLSKRGIAIPPQVHGPMAPIAPRVAAARQGGTTFLAQVRRGLGDAGFAQAITGFARVYAESLRQAPAAAGAAGPVAMAAPAPVSRPAPGDSSSSSIEALIGGGLAPDLAPAPQPVRPAPAPAPAPVAKPAPAPPKATQVQPAWGDLDLMPEGTDVGSKQPAPAPPPKKADAPPRDYGGLDLLPEEETESSVKYPAPLAEAALAAPAPPSPADGAKKGASGRVSPVAPPSNAPPPQGDDAPVEPEPVPSDPILAALRRFERQGDLAAISEAEALLEQELASAPHAVAAAAATAGLARVELLRGRAPAAEELARDALAKDPACPLAVEVVVRVGRGEADLAALTLALAQLRDAVDQRDPTKIRAVADRVRKQFPDEPHPYLAMYLVGRLTHQEKLAESGLKEAWKRFPSARTATMTFGPHTDADLVDLLIAHGRAPFDDKDDESGDRLRKTVEDIDDKENVIAGSLRMAVGLARVALSRPGVPRGVARRLTFSIARGLVGLQYFDAALPYIGKATGMGPNADESKAMSNERIHAGALRRAFDRPGIKAQTRAYPCVGLQAMSDSARQRLEAVRKDREAKEKEAFALGGDLAAKARVDLVLKREVTAAAHAAGVPDPFAAIDAAESELLQIQRERAATKAEPQAAQAGGLFGKLKAAASSVTGAAKDGLLSLKESQATAKRDEAAKHLGITLARTLSDVEWKHPALQQAALALATIEAFLDYFGAEESRGKAELNRLAEASA